VASTTRFGENDLNTPQLFEFAPTFLPLLIALTIRLDEKLLDSGWVVRVNVASRAGSVDINFMTDKTVFASTQH
jgi:hypothetical protein